MGKKKIIKLLKTFFPLLLGLFFVFYSLYGFSEEERQRLFLNIKQISPMWIVVCVIGGLLSHISRALRWRLLIEPLGHKLRFPVAFMAVMAGYLANLGIPRSGEVLRGAAVATYEDIPFEKVFGTIIAERAVDVIMVLIILAGTLLLHTDELFLFFEKYNINPLFSLLGMLVLLGMGILVLRLIKLSKHPFLVKIKKFASGLLDGVKTILHLKNNTVFIFHTLFIWGMYILTFYVLKFAFPGTEHLTISTMLVAFLAGSFAVSITNAGMGIYPIAIGVALSLFGVDKELGEAFGWVDWGIQTILSIIIGGLSLILLPLFKKDK